MPGIYTHVLYRRQCCYSTFSAYIELPVSEVLLFTPCLTFPAVVWPVLSGREECEHSSTASAFSCDCLRRSLLSALLTVIWPVLGILREGKSPPAVPACPCDHPMPRRRCKQSLNPLEQTVAPPFHIHGNNYNRFSYSCICQMFFHVLMFLRYLYEFFVRIH